MKIQVEIAPLNKGGYIARCRSLLGCQVRCDSFAQAQDKLIEAVNGYLASMDVAPCNVKFETHMSELVQVH